MDRSNECHDCCYEQELALDIWEFEQATTASGGD